MSGKKLSILICHIGSRAYELSNLLAVLSPQVMAMDDQAEIIINSEGPISVGSKRNKLVQSASGDYVAFIDDDDTISPDYISKIFDAIKTQPDCVGIEGVLRQGDQFDVLFRHSIEFAGWYTGPDAFYRTPNHLNPVRRSIALKVKFPEKNFGEDHEYSNELRKHLNTEVYIDGPIYYYNYKEKK